MKRIFLFAILALLLAGCDTGTSPSDETDTPAATTTPPALPDTPIVKPGETKTVYVKNSKWETVKTVTVTVAAREAVSEDALTDEVIAYNAAHTDDQQTILGEDVPIAESPIIDIYSVHPVTHAIISQYLDWERTKYVEKYDLFVRQTQSEGGVLYVDQIPPAPVIPDDTRPDYEKWALYLIAADGAILYEEHCENWKEGGWASAEAKFRDKKPAYEMQARIDGNGEYVIAGALYTAP